MANTSQNAATCFRLLTVVAGLLLSLPACRNSSDSGSNAKLPSASERLQAVNQLQTAGRLSDAIETCRRFLKQTPNDGSLHSKYAELLSGVGLSELARQQLQKLARNSDLTKNQLVCLLRNGRQLFSKSQLRRWQQAAPDDSRILHALAVHAVQNRDFCEALRLLKQAESDATDCRELRLWLTVRMASEIQAEDKRHLISLMESERNSSLGWRTIGEFLDRYHAACGSLVCYSKALALAPWDEELLNTVKKRLPRSSPIFPRVAERFGHVTEIGLLVNRLIVEATDTDMRQTVAHLESVQRYSEAIQWSRLALRSQSDCDWARDVILRLSGTQTPEHAALRLSLNAPRITQQDIAEIFNSFDSISEQQQFILTEESLKAGLSFVYENGRDRNRSGVLMHEWTGGGVGVVDIDNDSWPDLYLPQGGTLAKPLPNAVFRNIRGERFSRLDSVVENAISGYGQGVAVGDINEDGFDDIYVANIGVNKLLLSQGDGTFQSMHVSDDASWTTSCAIADIDFDGYPDLYDCNYLNDERAFSLTCDHEGEQRVCGPRDFAAAADKLLLSGGNGTFMADSPLTETSNHGRGMGILIGDLLNSDSNQLYVANDETANQLFQYSEGHVAETGTACGLAFDSFGRSLGSMGIACGDVDGSGTPFLFVTNYLSEPNNLYRGSTSQTFFDVAPAFGLSADGYPMVGFGCRFSDVDADGDVDLFVANGHLDDFRYLGRSYRMRSQLFENINGEQFREFDPEEGYFSKRFLGRAVAVLDWNGDGREDFVVTTIGDNIQLVTNETPGMFSDLRAKLIGTNSCRRPIGTRIQLTENQKEQTRWLTAGDGYQASSSPVCHFAVRDASSVELNVNWLSGPDEVVKVREQKEFLVLIEGRSTAYSVPR